MDADDVALPDASPDADSWHSVLLLPMAGRTEDP